MSHYREKYLLSKGIHTKVTRYVKYRCFSFHFILDLIKIIFTIILYFLMISELFYFTVINFTSLYFWIIKILVPPSTIMGKSVPHFSFPLKDSFFDFTPPPLKHEGPKKSPLPCRKGGRTLCNISHPKTIPKINLRKFPNKIMLQ